ncbi:septum site-determining protein MinC [Candidatus Nitrosacidococcus tergens]|uniref:Probable septum site-determining protein MinC n=1 Tax=Candidatus Nitrosacidococcus tergens TaxID=553981 RepID=A0A7G1QBW3_9GAMM|nr:septum site-determining protein MinC [Candidatus Nitrosacidococcus tergens]CAB1277600.1 putative septum site-determining protein MinC [Candidatus Nitrosacidococcus tergens]
MTFNLRDSFELKGELSALSVLKLRDTNIEKINHDLATKIKAVPGFFSNTPIIIDLGYLANNSIPLDFDALKSTLARYGLIPIGVRNAKKRDQEMALEIGLALLRDEPIEYTLPEDRNSNNQDIKSSHYEDLSCKALTITKPVRSGQQIYAKKCDLIVLSHTSPGSELLADGNIHIYGSLRGRALAGIHGDRQARIFCQSLEAELIAVAGNYKLINDIGSTFRGRSTQIYLQEEHLIVSLL